MKKSWGQWEWSSQGREGDYKNVYILEVKSLRKQERMGFREYVEMLA